MSPPGPASSDKTAPMTRCAAVTQMDAVLTGYHVQVQSNGSGLHGRTLLQREGIVLQNGPRAFGSRHHLPTVPIGHERCDRFPTA